VSVAVADDVRGPWVEPDARGGPTVLRGSPALRGPGHNCVVAAPDGGDVIVFHAWDAAFTARRMFLAPLAWTADGPRVTT
jgi:hypothetical protein